MTKRLKHPMKAPGAYSTRMPTDENQILLGGVASVRHVAASFTGSTCMSDADLAKGICAAMKSERISQAVKRAKVKR